MQLIAGIIFFWEQTIFYKGKKLEDLKVLVDLFKVKDCQ